MRFKMDYSNIRTQNLVLVNPSELHTAHLCALNSKGSLLSNTDQYVTVVNYNLSDNAIVKFSFPGCCLFKFHLRFIA